jgi:purine-binding chemotaxis protein CheW
MKERTSRPAETVDWDLIKTRLARMEAALNRDTVPDPATSRDILRARAAALARVPAAEAVREEQIEILEFGLADERYAVELRFVHEAYVLKELTPLPCTPPFVLGVVAARGRILSVIDLKAFFGLPDKGLTDLNKIIVLRNEVPRNEGANPMEFGVLADYIVGVRDLALAEMQASLPTLTGVRAEYLKGVTADRLVLLDARKLLEDESIIVEQDVA